MMAAMSDPLSKDLVAASSKPIVLSILARGENYGYAIIQEVRERSNGRLEWTEGMLYPVLHRLEEQKLIRARWVAGENGRKRKYYRISRSGTQALETEREQWMTVNGTLKALWG
jgi:DNA-binding PadR family transcriptional regulator